MSITNSTRPEVKLIFGCCVVHQNSISSPLLRNMHLPGFLLLPNYKTKKTWNATYSIVTAVSTSDPTEIHEGSLISIPFPRTCFSASLSKTQGVLPEKFKKKKCIC
jgi:hypothetical protein